MNIYVGISSSYKCCITVIKWIKSNLLLNETYNSKIAYNHIARKNIEIGNIRQREHYEKENSHVDST